jgi:PAS domain S-box-containing protein
VALALGGAVGCARRTAADAPGPPGTELLRPEERRWLDAHGAIRVGITEIPPQVLRADGGYDGLSIDYLRLLERKLGCRFTMVPYGSWSDLLAAARRREVDVVFAAQRTPERDAYLLFSDPYLELPNMILVRKDRQGGADLRTMDGWTVAVSEGSAVHEHLRREYPRLELRPLRDELAGLMRLSLGEVDAMVVEISRASYYIERAGILNLRVAGSAGLVYALRFAVRKDWPVLAGILDRGLAAVTADERREIGRRWILVGGGRLLASPVLLRWLGAGVAGIAILLAVVFGWNRALRRTVRQRTARLTQELAERERAEARLAEAQRTAHIGHWDLDLDTGRMSWSDETRRILGLDGQEPAPTWAALMERVHPDDRPGCEAALAEAVRGGPPYRREHRVVQPGGGLCFVHAEGALSGRDAGPARRVSGTLQDVTERRQAAQEIALLSFALDNVREAAYLTGEDARFLFVNEEACRALGYSRRELLEMGVEDIDPDFPAGGWSAHWTDLKARRGVLLERHHRTRDGRLFPVEVAANYFEYAGRGYNLALARDISERRRSEAERARIEEQLRQSQKLEAVGQLAGGVAHDFNNLLTAILGSAEELTSALDEASPLRACVDDIQGASQKAALLTRQLLTFGRRQAARPRVLHLGELVASTLRLLRRLIGEDVELTAVSQPGLGCVLADPSQLEQVILNLAVNARDAMPGGGRLTIETANADVGEEARGGNGLRPGRHVVLTVKDTGSGMTAEVQAHLFEPFFTTKEPGRGTGLGLSTVYGIVKECGGDVRVESEPGRGSTFRVFLPAVEGACAEATTPVDEAAGETPAPRGTESILVVEDEPAVRAIAVKALRDAGYAVVDAGDGAEALRLLAGPRPPRLDLVVTDAVMPRLGGLELAGRLRAERPDLRVLFVSGYTDRSADLQRCLDARTGFLAKPFTSVGLSRAVRDLLDGRAGVASA